MPEPEDSASEDLNPEPDNTTPTATPDVSLYEAKIADLNLQILTLNQTIESLNAEVTAQKAANYDLLMATPQGDETDADVDNGSETDDIYDTDVSIDDILYEKEN